MTTTAEQTAFDIPAEADLDRAPGLLDAATSIELTPQTCNLEYWLGAVAQVIVAVGTAMGFSTTASGQTSIAMG
ncbi:MAG: hypothetical protein ABI775_02485, partial [Pseudonocardiales bacterium]